MCLQNSPGYTGSVNNFVLYLTKTESNKNMLDSPYKQFQLWCNYQQQKDTFVQTFTPNKWVQFGKIYCLEQPLAQPGSAKHGETILNTCKINFLLYIYFFFIFIKDARRLYDLAIVLFVYTNLLKYFCVISDEFIMLIPPRNLDKQQTWLSTQVLLFP